MFMIKTRLLGKTGVAISAIGYGAMRLSIQGRPPEAEAIAVLHKAFELGITLIDTADAYCLDETDKHHNEALIAKALAAYAGDTSRAIVATKGACIRPEGAWEVDGNPERLRHAIRKSYKALGEKAPIALWQLHAVDPAYPIEESLRPVKEAVAEGLVRHVGLSNVSVEQISRARKMVEVVSVQNEYSLWWRVPEKDGVLEYCEAEGLAFIPYRPLGGRARIAAPEAHPQLARLAAARGVTPGQLALAWLLAKSPCILPIPGPTRIEHLVECVGAANILLAPDDVRRIEQVM